MNPSFTHTLLRKAGLFSAGLVAVLFSQPALAQTINVTGNVDVGTGAPNQTTLTGDMGFTLAPYPITISNNLIDVARCNGDPNHCTSGSTVSLAALQGDFTAHLTLNGNSYASGCSACTASFAFQFGGSFVLPPAAPTATVTAPFDFSGQFRGDPSAPQVALAGAGTATIALHSPAFPGGPATSWHIDRVTYRFDSGLPAPWLSVDIGATGTAGATSFDQATGAWHVSGAGADIWGAADAFQFAFPAPSGNQVTARVDSEDSTNPFAKAGVMLRASFDAGSPHVILDVKPNGALELMTRGSANGDTTFLATAQVTFPVWLRLSLASGVTASISEDGSSWQTLGVLASPFGAGQPFAGLVVTSHDPSALNHAVFSNVQETTNSTTPPPPFPWTSADIGAVGQIGDASLTGSVFTLHADGSDIWGTADSFHYVYQPWTGKGDLVAHVTRLDNTSTFAKAGVMIRSSADPASADVILDMRPDGSLEFMSRPSSGGGTTFIAGGPHAAPPIWLRLVRDGTMVSGYWSADGTSWQAIGSADVPDFSTPGVIGGLAATSHDAGALATATFDNVSLTINEGLPAGWSHQDVGSTGLAGTTSYNTGRFSIQGAGADIWGTSDAFQFAYTPVDTSTEGIQARIVSEDNTSPFAKTGVMIRSSLAADSAFVMLDMKPDGSVEFMARPGDGASVNYLGGAPVGFGMWIRVLRIGSTFTASYSSDDVIWTDIGTVTVTMPPSVDSGIIVCSHDSDRLSTGVVDQWALVE